MIDRKSLKEDLIHCYGTAKEVLPFAESDLVAVDSNDFEKLSDKTLAKMAAEAGLDIADYMIFYDGD